MITADSGGAVALAAGAAPTSAAVSTVVLVMTDVEGSTRSWAEHPAGMDAAMVRHHEIVHGAITAHGGWRPVDQGEGDAVFATFDSAAAAVAAVVDFQRALAAEVWPDGIHLKVRVGVHAGEVISRGGNLFGSTVNRCARLRGLGAGGQVLLSAPAFELVRDNLPEGVTVVDLGEHRMKDLTRPEPVYQLEIPGLPATFPPLSSLDRTEHNLPVQTSSFLGRAREIADLVDLVRRERLVTIVGFGGMGKTRLALQVAAELATGDGDGVWFVDLSAVTDPAQVASLIATTLGIGEDSSGILSGLLAGLRGKRLLLVLDNLEQLLPEAAHTVGQLLRAGPDLRILVTSREPLRLSGEHEYSISALPVPPLPRPGVGLTEAELGSLSTFDAVRLFLTRSTAVRRDLTLTATNAAAVAGICARLDGMPLALELAAARIRALSPEALLTRLDHALTVLTGGNRDLPNRQRTLRATIAWSYDALQPDEQQLLDRLSVFPGTFALDAAEHICGPAVADDDHDLDVLGGISTLVDRSLLQHHDGVDGSEDRYSLLVSIRDFATEQLTQRGETSTIETRHAAYFAELVTLRREYTPDDERLRRRIIGDELHNLRTALAFSSVWPAVDPRAQLAVAVSQEFGWSGLLLEAREVVTEALAHAESAGPARTRLLLRSAEIERFFDQDVFLAVAETAVAAARALIDPSLLLDSLTYLALASRTRHQVRAVLADADQVIARLPISGTDRPRWSIVELWEHNLYVCLYTDPERVLENLKQLAASEGEASEEVRASLGSVLMQLGRWEEAERSLAQYEDPKRWRDMTPIGILNCLMDATRLRVATGRIDQAAENIEMVDCQLALIDPSPVYASWAAFLRAAIDRRKGDFIGARRRVENSIGRYSDPGDVAPLLWLASVLAREAGDVESAEERLLRAWSAVAGRDAFYLDLTLECLLERAVQVGGTRPRESVRLIGLAREHQGPFALLDGVDYDTEGMLADLRDRLGQEEVQRILDSTVGQPLPDDPTLGSG